METRVLKEALTFDDVLLVPRYSEVLPRQVDIRSRLTRNIQLNVPLVSAAMDSVTESEMAIAVARAGGIGVLHKNMSIERQAAEVDRVKRSESGMIADPVTLSPDKTIREALAVMGKYRISGIPVVKERKLVGILTNRDLRFETDLDQPIEAVMTKENLVTSPLGTPLDEAEQILQRERIEKLPLVDGSDELAGLITVKDIQKKRLYPDACKDERGRLRVGAAVGVAEDALERAEALVEKQVDVLVIDTAHGHSAGVMRTIRDLRKRLPDQEIIAGNVATTEGAEALMKLEVDAVKVGVGPGASCTTRIVSGVGVPQLTAILDCAEASRKHDIPLIADGGVRYSGDIAKALAAGAESVMIGSIFAGMEESPGEVVVLDGRSYKVYRGMGSLSAMRSGARDRYFQEGEATDKLVPEGIEGRVPYRGMVQDTIRQLTGGLKAAMGYCGAGDLATFREQAKFVEITEAGIRESHPHDVVIARAAPNYQGRDAGM